MPELPEVECLTRAVRRVAEGGLIERVTFHRKDLRVPIPIPQFRRVAVGQPIRRVFRRSKYLLWETPRGYGVLHLGMSGHLVDLSDARRSYPHTHAVFRVVRGGDVRHLHYVDPRRFGRITCIAGDGWETDPLFAALGPEPLEDFDLAEHLFNESRRRRTAIKTFLMDNRVVVGVGNIYASESLFRSGIRPGRSCQRVTRAEFAQLAPHIRDVLAEAISQGGTTFRDFRGLDGDLGYFSVRLAVYGREGEPCRGCDSEIKRVTLGGRSAFYCPTCQK